MPSRARSTGGHTRFGIKQRLYAAFGVVAALAVVAGMIGVTAFDTVSRAVETVSEEHLPRVITAQRLSENGVKLAAETPKLAAVTRGEKRERVRRRLEDQLETLRSDLNALSSGETKAVERSCLKGGGNVSLALSGAFMVSVGAHAARSIG